MLKALDVGGLAFRLGLVAPLTSPTSPEQNPDPNGAECVRLRICPGNPLCVRE